MSLRGATYRSSPEFKSKATWQSLFQKFKQLHLVIVFRNACSLSAIHPAKFTGCRKSLFSIAVFINICIQ